jgi:carotenoid cleavage dioxygenase-like enzyme
LSSTTAAPVATDLRKGFETLDREVTLDSLAVEGRLPEWLSGSLLRTGPAKFEDGERSVRHWFDGLAMLHRFSFAGGRVSYGCRFLRSPQYRHVQERGRIGYEEFATDPCRSLFRRVQTLFTGPAGSNANVNVSRLGERFVAMTETPMPVAFDPQTLETLDVEIKRAPGHHSTAHPHHDPARGEAVNHVIRFGPRSHYRFYAQADERSRRMIGSIAVREPGYVHSFGMTERYLILAVGPFQVDPLRMLRSGRPFIENYEWRPERGARFYVIDREDGSLRGEYETDAFFTFHHINSFHRNGELVVDLCAFDDPGIIDALYLDRRRAGDPVPPVRARRFVLDLGGDGITAEQLADTDFELPRIDYRRRNGRPYRFAWGTGADGGEWIDRIVKLDVERGEAGTWRREGCYPGEPVFVADPGRQAEDAGALLSVVLDARKGSSFLLVLDASTLDELARAEVPHHIPYSFHGQFFRT